MNDVVFPPLLSYLFFCVWKIDPNFYETLQKIKKYASKSVFTTSWHRQNILEQLFDVRNARSSCEGTYVFWFVLSLHFCIKYKLFAYNFYILQSGAQNLGLSPRSKNGANNELFCIRWDLWLCWSKTNYGKKGSAENTPKKRAHVTLLFRVQWLVGFFWHGRPGNFTWPRDLPGQPLTSQHVTADCGRAMPGVSIFITL